MRILAVAFHLPSASGTPVSQRHEGPGTPSSGQLGTPASGSWRTPTGSVGKRDSFGKGLHGEDVPCRSLGQAQKSGTRSNLGSGTGRTSDESVLFAEEDVCLSQAPSALVVAQEGVRCNAMETVIPETLPLIGGPDEGLLQETASKKGMADTAESDDDGVEVPEPPMDTILPDRATSDGTAANESSALTKGVVEWALPATEFQSLEGDTVSAETHAEPGSSPTTQKVNSQGTRPHGTRRQAALHNKLCPSPAVTPGSTSDAGRETANKKVNLGRGRSAQGVARGEKGSNMKPLAQIGIQEKFRAPAVVNEAGKGRGRGGKPSKRKRD